MKETNTMKPSKFQLLLRYFFAVVLLFAGISHFTSPEMYTPLIPDFLPTDLSNYGAGALEVLLGLGLLLKGFRSWSALGFTLLMVLFLLLHLWDLFRDDPALIRIVEQMDPNYQLENVRLILVVRAIAQFLLIFGGWWLYRKERSTSVSKT